MRTTVTLDPDLAARLRQLAHERGISFKAALNAAVRAGIEGGNPAPKAYRERTRDLGVLPGIDLTKALALAGRLEDDEVIRQLESRK